MKYFFATILGLSICLTSCNQRVNIVQKEADTLKTANTPIEHHGSLSVVVNKIIDKHGLATQLRGISFSWSIWGGRKYYNEDVVDWLVDDFKVNILRLAMAIEPANGYLEKPEEQKQLITRIADKAIKRGVYVIIDWHDHNANKNVAEAKSFFSDIARQYAGIPNIIYEIWNEPEYQSWDEIKAYAAEIIPAIRQHDSQNLIIVGSPRWDQDVDLAALDPITGYTNIAYAFHFYASDPNHQENLRQKAEKALEAGLPLFVTEWGVGEADGDGIFNIEKTSLWMEWMEKHQLSWVNWNITDKIETTALLRPGAPVTGNWDANQLTEAGDYIRNQLRKLNASAK